MNEERRKQQILHILAAGIRKVMEEAHLDYGKLQEIRLRTDQPLLILYQGEEYFCLQDGRKAYGDKRRDKGDAGIQQSLFPLCV